MYSQTKPNGILDPYETQFTARTLNDTVAPSIGKSVR